MKQQPGTANITQNTGINVSNVDHRIATQVTEPQTLTHRNSFSVGASFAAVGGQSNTPVITRSYATERKQPAASGYVSRIILARSRQFDCHKAIGDSSKARTTLVDSCAMAQYLDNELVPDLQHRLAEYKGLEQPHKLFMTGRNMPKGVTTAPSTAPSPTRTEITRTWGVPVSWCPDFGDTCFL